MAAKKVNRVDKHVGGRIRMRRLMLGTTQTKLADAIGVAFQQVQKYEKGTNRVSPSRLHNIAEVLEVPVSFFFEGAPSSGSQRRSDGTPDFVTDFCMTSDGLALAKAFMAIGDKSVRRSIVQLVGDLADEGA